MADAEVSMCRGDGPGDLGLAWLPWLTCIRDGKRIQAWPVKNMCQPQT